MNKIICIALSAMLFALSVSVQAQEPAKIPRIGYVSATGSANNPGPQIEAFRQGLRDLGRIDGKNVVVEYRYLDGKLDRIPSLVAQLVDLKVDVFCPKLFIGNSRGQTGDKVDSHCHSDDCGSSCNGISRQLGTPRWKHHWAHETYS
jgi:hypothetical protein